MNSQRIVLEINWDRRVALTLALVVGVPLALLGGLLTALAAHAPAAPAAPALSSPTTLAYQGQVSVGGQPFSGQGQFKFAVVNSNGSAAFWTNDGTSQGSAPFQPASAVNLTVTAGLFNVLLGDTSLAHMTVPIGSGVFLQPGRALRVWFNDGTHGFQQLAPDVALAAVPYALNAETLDGLDSNLFVQGGQGVSRLSNDAGYLTQSGADARYARNHPTSEQIALLKWYTAISSTQANFATGTQPSFVAFDGTNIWVTNSGPGTVSVLRASDGFHVMTPTVGGAPYGIAFDGVNMWVVNDFNKTVSVLRARDGFHVMTPTVGAAPIAIAFDGTNMWVANQGAGTVSVLRASDGFHVMTPTVGQGPYGLAFDGANMWVTSLISGSVSVLRASDGFHVMTPTVGAAPLGIAFDGTNMWVANGPAHTVSVLRVNDGFHVMTPTAGLSPYGLAFDGANMWITDFSGDVVSVLAASNGSLVKTLPVGVGPEGIAFDGAFMWIANLDSTSVSKR